MEEKDYSISVIRLISMLMIISCHILQGLNNRWAFWINVGVQIFFFMSGFLYGKKIIKNNKEFYKKRIIKVLVPYCIIFTIVLFLDFCFLNNSYPIKRIIGCFLGLGAFGNNIPILTHTWFVSYILLCYILVPLLQFIFNKPNFKSNFLIFLVITLLIQILNIYEIINIEACWINNFIYGYFYGKCCNEEKQERKFNIFITILLVIIMPLAVIYQEKIPIILPDILNTYSNIIVNYGHVLLGTSIFIILHKLFNKLNLRKSKLLLFSDKYSYYIYLVHLIFILRSFSVLFLTKYLFINITLIILLSIISALLLKNITDLLLLIINEVYCKLFFLKKKE